MEPHIPEEQPILESDPQSGNPQPKNRLIAVLVVSILLLVVLGLIRDSRQSDSIVQTTSTVTTVPTKFEHKQVVSPTGIYDNLKPQLTSEWVYRSQDICDVAIPVPPKKEPYFYPKKDDRQPGGGNMYGTGVYWMYPGQGAISPELLVHLPQFVYDPAVRNSNPSDGDEVNYKSELIMLSAPDWGGSGYIPGALAVQCMQNTQNLSNAALVDELTRAFDSYNKKKPEFLDGADSYTIKEVKYEQKWGKEILLLTIDEYYKNGGGKPFTMTETHTMFATPKYIYEIQSISMAPETFLRDTVKVMFDNLKFE